MKKVCIITCYFQPDYVRSRALRAGLASNPNVELTVIKNRHVGLLRYPEVLLRIIWQRIKSCPDVFVLSFRGQEILPLVLLLVWPKPVIFDEFIVPLAWAKQEGHRATFRTRVFKFLANVSAPFYRLWLKSCRYILTDTDVHARISAELSRIPTDKYWVIPVSTDETLFKLPPKPVKKSDKFQVFFYGLKMTPLHGLKYILQAAEILGPKYHDIEFLIIGGDETTRVDVESANKNGARVKYEKFVPFEKLPNIIYESHLCLGGPFGGTPQASQVVTGKAYQFLACAAPTIMGDSEAVSQFTAGRDCLIVPQADAKALADKVEWAYKHAKELDKIGQAGRATYERLFSIKVVKEKLKEVIN